jgi:hypothetical protein
MRIRNHADQNPVHHFDAGPDQDPDPTYQFDADPDPQHRLSASFCTCSSSLGS